MTARTMYYVTVRYAAGRAGSGWPVHSPRTVRIPHITQSAADRTRDAALSGAGGCCSGLPTGVIPDSVSLTVVTP